MINIILYSLSIILIVLMIFFSSMFLIKERSKRNLKHMNLLKFYALILKEFLQKLRDKKNE